MANLQRSQGALLTPTRPLFLSSLAPFFVVLFLSSRQVERNILHPFRVVFFKPSS